MKMFSLEASQGAAPLVLMWEISYLISNTVTARKLKFYKYLDGSSVPFANDNFFRKRCLMGAAPLV